MSQLRLAVLIDADNSSADILAGLMAEIEKLGNAAVRRIYGDFTAPNHVSWKKVLQKYAIKPVQQFAYTSGKNATDITLIIDAMDLLHSKLYDGFCLVSSDSDFTGLALRIREEGLRVIGFGEQKTPEAFRRACDKFFYIEKYRNKLTSQTQAQVQSLTPDKSLSNEQPKPQVTQPSTSVHAVNAQKLRELLLNAFTQTAQDSGWVHLGPFGAQLRLLQPQFRPQLYGRSKLTLLVQDHQDLFEMPNPASSRFKLKER